MATTEATLAPPTHFDELMASLEDMRHGRAEGDPPPAPAAYDDTYRPPAHRVKLLETRHSHARDEDSLFLEGPHLYIVRGRPMEVSVTGVVSAFMEPFDADLIIAKMAASRSEAWPRVKYAVGVARADAPCGGCDVMLVSQVTGKTLWAGPAPATATREWALTRARAKERGAADVDWYTYERAMTAEEIKAEWSRNATEKSNMGTEAHLMMELWSNSEPVRNCPELRNGLTFLWEQLRPHGVKCFRTEWELHCGAEEMAGSADWIGIFPDGSLIIVDWKRTVNHEVHSAWNKKMGAPLSHLDATDVAKFSLQLSTYKFMIEKYYGYTVSCLALCSIHPDHPFHFYAPYMQREVEFLMARRRARVALKARLEVEAPDAPRCSGTGEIAWKPVRVEGKLYDAQYAAWHHEGAPAEPDIEAAAHIQRLEESVVTMPMPEEAALARCTPWRERVPEEGVTTFKRCDEF